MNDTKELIKSINIVFDNLEEIFENLNFEKEDFWIETKNFLILFLIKFIKIKF